VKRKQIVWIALAAAALIVVIVTIRACSGSGSGARRLGTGFEVTVEVARVERGPIRHTVQYVGSAEPYESVRVVPKITGILTSLPVQIGDWVNEGDLIATIDEAEYAQRLDQARANLGLAEARLVRSRINLQLAERELARVESMADEGLTSDQQLDQVTTQRDGARADVQLAEADVTRARAAYDEARINFENTRITARLAGSIDKRQVDPGTLVSPTTVLCTIVRTNPAKVVLNVPEAEIGLLRVGAQAVVTAAAGTVEILGVVERVAPTVDPATRTMTAEIVVPNSAGALRPGMYADVTLLIEEKPDVVLVPEQALVRREDQTEVFRVVDGTARSTPVSVGIATEGAAEVVDGLTAGDLVVVRGQYLLNDGDPVRYEAPVEGAGT
jgi:RND family efflux transporter MFP subunit